MKNNKDQLLQDQTSTTELNLKEEEERKSTFVRWAINNPSNRYGIPIVANPLIFVFNFIRSFFSTITDHAKNNEDTKNNSSGADVYNNTTITNKDEMNIRVNPNVIGGSGAKIQTVEVPNVPNNKSREGPSI